MDGHISPPLHCYACAGWGWIFGDIGVDLSLSDVAMPWLRLNPPVECISHLYDMYTKCFSTLICCGWAYESTLLHCYAHARCGWTWLGNPEEFLRNSGFQTFFGQKICRNLIFLIRTTVPTIFYSNRNMFPPLDIPISPIGKSIPPKGHLLDFNKKSKDSSIWWVVFAENIALTQTLKMSHCHPTPVGLASLSMESSAMSSNHGAIAPY